MNRTRILLAVALVSCAALTFAATSCTKERPRHVLDPTTTIRIEDIKNARWIDDDEELRQVTERAAKSPLMNRAVTDQASDPRLSFLPSAVVGAIGKAPDGSAIRFTVLPFQYSDDMNHALYFALVESKFGTKVESVELLRNRKPGADAGFEPLNDGEHGIWMRQGPVYVTTSSGIVRRAPDRFKENRFVSCFFLMADQLLREVHRFCDQMGDLPRCVTYGSGVAFAVAGAYCAFLAYA